VARRKSAAATQVIPNLRDVIEARNARAFPPVGQSKSVAVSFGLGRDSGEHGGLLSYEKNQGQCARESAYGESSTCQSPEDGSL